MVRLYASLLVAIAGTAPPRVAVEVFRERGTSIIDDDKTASEIARVLSAKGFGLVELKSAVRPFSIDLEDPVRSAASEAAKAGVDLIVLGRTSTTGETIHRTLAGTFTTTTALTKVELRAIRTDNATVLWSDAETGMSRVRTATSVAARFGDEVLAQWSTEREALHKKVLVRLSDATGVLSIEDLREFKEELFIVVDGVEEVLQRSLDDKSALLEIMYGRDRASFERAIDGLAVNKKRLALKGVSGGAVLAELK